MKRVPLINDLPSFDAGLSAALRRAFAPPDKLALREFEELLARLH